ncbi:MAG: type IX secretion system outer membrane channel protein PorV [Leadbetterella sp.]
MNKSFLKAILGFAFLPLFVTAQQTTTNEETDWIPVTTAVPFIGITPDCRAGAMGDAGAASDADAASLFWNTAKLAFAENKFAASVSYTPWLRNIVNDMGLTSVYGYKKISNNQTITGGINYFDQGAILFTDGTGNEIGNFNSREFVITAGLASKLGSKLAGGVNLKYINSNLVGALVINGNAGKPGRTVAFDISLFKTKDSRSEDKKVNMDYGLVIQNIGGRVNYGYGQYFIPANLKLGTKMNVKGSGNGQFNVLLDFNKLLVPTPNNRTTSLNSTDKSIFNSIFSSFSDAPHGIKEELAEITTSLGLEYNYADRIAIRGGLFYESEKKGNRTYGTFGAGIVMNETLVLDLAYLVAAQANPLANTWRVTFTYAMPDGSKK